MPPLPVLATVSDFEERLTPEERLDADQLRAQAALHDASVLIRTETGLTWVDAQGDLVADVPEQVGAVVLAVALRAYRNPGGYTAETVGPYSYTRGPNGDKAGLWLTGAERRMLKLLNGRQLVRTARLVYPHIDEDGNQL